MFTQEEKKKENTGGRVQGENLFAELSGGDQDWHREMGGKRLCLCGRETAYMLLPSSHLLTSPLVFILATAVRHCAVVYDHGQRWWVVAASTGSRFPFG